MNTMTDKQFGPWLKWAWVYQSLTVDDFPTLDAALGAAWAQSEAGNGVLHFIEGPDGIVAEDIVDADNDRRCKAESASDQARPRNTHRVVLSTPDGKESASIRWHTSKADAVAEASRLREVYGDRVSVKRCL